MRSLHIGTQVGISRCEFPQPTRWNYNGRIGFLVTQDEDFCSLVVVLIPTGAWASEMTRSGEVRLAALAMPTGTRADWQQWDSFLTNVVKKLVKQLGTGIGR